jgi:hypothetical protein
LHIIYRRKGEAPLLIFRRKRRMRLHSLPFGGKRKLYAVPFSGGIKINSSPDVDRMGLHSFNLKEVRNFIFLLFLER